MRVLGISGSLRKGSYNTALLRAACELSPAGMTIDVASVGDIPLYNDDVRKAGYPAAVQRLRDAIAANDAVLFVTPEYNYSISGVLKNAIDWASRPPDQPFAGKPVAMMGASGSTLGTARAQYHLRQMCVFLDMHPLNKPEVFVSKAPSKFDEQGRLVDEDTRQLVRSLLDSLARWTIQLKSPA